MVDTLSTVADFVTQARTSLQDLVSPYRYPDDDLVTAINMAFYEVSRLRPDILMDAAYTSAVSTRGALGAPSVPAYTAADQTPIVPIPNAYRMALIYFMVGYAQLRDAEEVQDARASQFMNKFTSQLLQTMA